MPTYIDRIHAAIHALKNGEIIILTDSIDRENEGDFVVPAETVTTEQMNFMIRYSGGIVCLPMTRERLEKLHLPLMVPTKDNMNLYHTPFTISIDARHHITTGVSAADRTMTVHTAIDENTKPEDLVRPGHLFPLQAKDGGVFERQGHTEGSVDLLKIAGFKPAAVITEVMNPDGTMARGIQLDAFAKTHHLALLSIEDIIHYRLAHEDMIAMEAEVTVPLEQYGNFSISCIKEKINGAEHLVLFKPPKNPALPLLLRIHSACMTGDLFASKRCDCHKQFHYALQRISDEGGMLIYLSQEGRGIGLLNKIRAYALQEQGFDTVEANQQLGLPVDSRRYYIAANILRNKHIHHVRLLTNNPDKVDDLKKYGIAHVDKILMPSFDNEHNRHYLCTKKNKLNHSINLDSLPDLLRVSQ